MSSRDAALAEFLDETSEMLERITLNLSVVERGDGLEETLHEIYRDFHSLKGNAYLYGFTQMGQVAHVLESSLDPIRKGFATFNSHMIDGVYEGLDLIKALREGVKSGGNEPDLSKQIHVVIPKIAAITSAMFDGEHVLRREFAAVGQDVETEKLALKKMSADSVENIESTENAGDSGRPVTDRPVQKPKASKPRVGAIMEKDSQEHGAAHDTKHSETLRVQVGILDKLMNLVGELVLVRNQHLQNETVRKEASDTALNQRLNVVTGELQEEVMKTRMQPIGTILAKYQRVVRDLSRDLGKTVTLVMEGNETELDKTLLEAVKDPLMHIVRNSVDHGIETPEQRQAVGKPPEGVVKIKSYHEGGQVVVEIEDDGKGLNRKKICEKIVEKGLSTAEKLESMSDRDVFLFLFAPGFSTAEKVSNVSGRGVGMDVVRTNIEQIGGMIDLTSVQGKGTIIRLKIPLTLAIIPALIVRSGGERFAIPQVKLVELVRLEKDEDGRAKGLESLQGQPVYRLRGQLLPLVGLNGVLELSSKLEGSDSENIVVLNADSGTFGLVVDEIDDSADIVVKPLMQFLKDQTIYSGATVLGDGSVALAIDVMALANKVGILAALEKEAAYKLVSETEENLVDNADYLLVDIGAKGSYAIPLCLVNRLEEFPQSSLELTGAQRVVQYREGLLPILSVSDFLKLPYKIEDSVDENQKCSVVVVQKTGKLFGLEVKEIIDVVNVNSVIDADLIDRPGILGTMVVNKEVVVLVDVYAIIETIMPQRKAAANVDSHAGGETVKETINVLIVEDNAFFRKQITRILAEQGFNVFSAVNGQEGLKTLEKKFDQISLVLSDIEMPIMNGFEMAEAIRKNEKFKDLPLIALTTLFRKKDIKRGREVGFSKYLEKLNPETLVKEIDEILDLDRAG